MADAGSSSRVAKVDAGNGVAKKDVAGRVVEPLVPVSASSAGIAMLAQAKLSVGRVDDPAELEADEMAQKFSQWNGAGGSVEVSEGSSGGDAMRSADTGTLETGGFEVGADVQSEISSRSGRGVPLADDQRSKFEKFFGKDLSAVRVHADSDASELSGSLGAEAFTVGNDVYFGSGHYQSGASDKLLAHELTHVVQQNSTINRLPKWMNKMLGRNQAPPVPPRNRTSSPYGDSGVRQNPLFDAGTTDEAGYEIPYSHGVSEEPTHQTLEEVQAQVAAIKASEPSYNQVNKTPPPVPPRMSKDTDRSQTHEDWAPGMFKPSRARTHEDWAPGMYTPKAAEEDTHMSMDQIRAQQLAALRAKKPQAQAEEPTHQTLEEVRAQMAAMTTSEPSYSQVNETPPPVPPRMSKDVDRSQTHEDWAPGMYTPKAAEEPTHQTLEEVRAQMAAMTASETKRSNWTSGTDEKEKDHAKKKMEKKDLKAEKSFIKTQGTLLKYLPDVPQDERLILAKISPDSVTTRYGKPGKGLTKTEYEVFGKYSDDPLVKKAMGIKNDLPQLQQIAEGGDKTKVWNSLTLTERMVAAFYAFEVKAKGNHDCDESWSHHNAAFLEGASMNPQNEDAKKSAIKKRTKKAWDETLTKPTPEDLSQLKNKKDQEKIPLQQDILRKIMTILKEETYVDGAKYDGQVETLLSHGGRVNMIIPKLAGKDSKKDEFMIKMGLFDEKGKKNSKAGVEKRLASSHDIVKNPDGTFRETKASGPRAVKPKLGQKLGMNIAAGGAGKLDINGEVIKPDGSHGHLYMHWVPPTEKSDGVFQVGLETTAFSFGSIKGTTGRSHGWRDNEDTATPVSSMDGAKNDRKLMGLGGSIGSVYKRLPDDWAETLLKATDETKEKLGETAKQS